MNALDTEDFLAQLRSRARLERTTFNQCWSRLMGAEDPRTRFQAYMVETYHYVSFTCPLLARFEARMRAPNPALADYLARHCQEEEGHDEWLLKDLHRLGFDPGKVRDNWPRLETVALVGSQLYAIDHAPRRLGHLGYIYALESAPVAPRAVDALADHLALPRAALSTFRAHGELDPDHEDDLEDAILDHVSEAAEQAAVSETMVMSYRHLCELVLGLALDPLEEIEAGLARLRDAASAAQPSA